MIRYLRFLGVATCAAVALVVLAACSGQSASRPHVASIPSAPTHGTPTSTGARTGPSSANRSEVDRQLPLGATKAQIDRAYNAYYACWTAHGIPSTSTKKMHGGPLLTYKLDPKKYQKQVDACADQEPLNPPELDPHQNPDYYDDLRDELKCMRHKGYPLVIHPGQPGLWLPDPATSAVLAKFRSDRAVQAENACEIQSYRKH